jgi:AAA+ ATPase superfamily predicted ATPase
MNEVPPYRWPLHDHFIDRAGERGHLEDWWESDDSVPVSLYGRRRVGKSWLLRRFAHDKPALFLVAHRIAPGTQLATFAERLAPTLGFRPDLPDLPALVRVLYRIARDRKVLAVIDEFPWLLPGTVNGNETTLTAMQAVMEEERDESELRLVLCGSAVAQMEALTAEKNPLHARLQPMQIRPLAYDHAALFMPALTTDERFERFAITGGMPRYLTELGPGTLRSAVCRRVLDRDAPLWDEARTVLDQELRESRNYFAIVSQLSTGDKEINEIAQGTRLTAPTVSKYLNTLQRLRIVTRRLPFGAAADSRSGRWRLDDPFFRFWFRFVFPYQDELETGLRAEDLFDTEVTPALPTHVAPVFEEWCRAWTRQEHGRVATQVRAWWGPSLNALRRSGERSTEEIDIVGGARGQVTVVGEAKWRTRPMDRSVLTDLFDYKIPALRQAGFTISQDLTVFLFARSGYSPALQRAAADDDRVRLVDVTDLLGESSGN